MGAVCVSQAPYCEVSWLKRSPKIHLTSTKRFGFIKEPLDTSSSRFQQEMKDFMKSQAPVQKKIGVLNLPLEGRQR